MASIKFVIISLIIYSYSISLVASTTTSQETQIATTGELQAALINYTTYVAKLIPSTNLKTVGECIKLIANLHEKTQQAGTSTTANEKHLGDAIGEYHNLMKSAGDIVDCYITLIKESPLTEAMEDEEETMFNYLESELNEKLKMIENHLPIDTDIDGLIENLVKLREEIYEKQFSTIRELKKAIVKFVDYIPNLCDGKLDWKRDTIRNCSKEIAEVSESADMEIPKISTTESTINNISYPEDYINAIRNLVNNANKIMDDYITQIDGKTLAQATENKREERFYDLERNLEKKLQIRGNFSDTSIPEDIEKLKRKLKDLMEKIFAMQYTPIGRIKKATTDFLTYIPKLVPKWKLSLPNEKYNEIENIRLSVDNEMLKMKVSDAANNIEYPKNYINAIRTLVNSAREIIVSYKTQIDKKPLTEEISVVQEQDFYYFERELREQLRIKGNLSSTGILEDIGTLLNELNDLHKKIYKKQFTTIGGIKQAIIDLLNYVPYVSPTYKLEDPTNEIKKMKNTREFKTGWFFSFRFKTINKTINNEKYPEDFTKEFRTLVKIAREVISKYFTQILSKEWTKAITETTEMFWDREDKLATRLLIKGNTCKINIKDDAIQLIKSVISLNLAFFKQSVLSPILASALLEYQENGEKCREERSHETQLSRESEVENDEMREYSDFESDEDVYNDERRRLSEPPMQDLKVEIDTSSSSDED